MTDNPWFLEPTPPPVHPAAVEDCGTCKPGIPCNRHLVAYHTAGEDA